MPQIFHRSSNVLSRASIVFGIVLLISIVLLANNITPYTHTLKVAIGQPIPFSHMHHVEQLGIDCRYCHTSVEKGPFAGIPATETCYTCHNQVWTNSPLLQPVRDSIATDEPMRWNRVNVVPDFVYFDHSIHIAKGVSCYTCHGPVNEMNLLYKEHAFEMKWCLTCHRNPEEFIREQSEIYNPNYKQPRDKDFGKALVEHYGIKKEQITNCWVCHR